VDVFYGGATRHISATSEVVLSLGAIHTPKVLMQSGIGDANELRRLGIPVVQHLPGVGQNLQDHPGIGLVWESQQELRPHNTGAEVLFFRKSDPNLDAPDLQACHAEAPFTSAENADRFGLPEFGWSWFGAVLRPKSRGRVRLTGPDPFDPVHIETNMLSHPDDVKAAVECVEVCREIGNSVALRPFTKREVMPGGLKGPELVSFVRDAAITYWHQTCTAKMGQDAMSVVDGSLKVYGIEQLCIADGSIMPRITTGNTMAPCVIIGERASEVLRRHHGV
jgi:choline dehydrogenase